MPTAAHLRRLARALTPPDEPDVPDTDLLRRYAADRDEAAFAELVRRNGPLVLRACRHVLGEAAADDAFQATFLLLVRSARRLTRPGSLAGWLHATAVKVARNARRGEDRRRKREAARRTPAATSDDLTWHEVREVLDAEVAALPEVYRLPVVLCYLQELGHDEAARRAGCTVGALRGRLERGKDRLRKRLARYGLPVAAPALVVGGPPPVSAAQVDGVLAAVQAGLNGAVPSALAGLVGASGWPRVVLLMVPAVVAVGVALVAGGFSPADPPQVEPPRPAPDQPKRTDRFGDPLPDGALVRLGTLRDRATIQAFGTAPDGTVVTVGYVTEGKRVVAEARVWPPNADRPGEPVRLGDFERGTFKPCAAVSPDGRYVAVNTPLAVVIWDRTGDMFKKAASFDCYLTSHLLFAPDGSRLAAVGPMIQLIDRRTGRLRELPGMADPDYGVAFSGDGKRLAATSGRDVAVWDLETGERLVKYQTGRVRYADIALDHTGRVLAVSPKWEPETVVFVDSMTGLPIADLAGPEKFQCRWVSYAPGGKTVLLGDRDGVTWWDPAAGKVIRRFEGMAHNWSAGQQKVPARFTPDGKTLVGTSGRALLRWDAATGKPLRPEVHAGHHSVVTSVGVSADGKWIATGGYDTRVRVWEAATSRPVASSPGAWLLHARDLEFSPDGRFVYGPSADDTGVSKWEAATGREVLRFQCSPNAPRRHGVLGSRLSPDGLTLMAGISSIEAHGPVLVAGWDTGSGKALFEKSFDQLDPMRQGTAFSPDGRWLAAYSSLFPLKVGPAGNVLPNPKEGFGLDDPGAFSADGRLMSKVWYRRGQEVPRRVVAFEVATGAIVAEIPLGTWGRLAFHPDGRSVAVAEDQRLAFYDLGTGKAFASWKAHGPDPDFPTQSFAQGIRYFPDGTKVVTGHGDTTALVWQAPARPKMVKALTEKERAAAWADLIWADGTRGWAAVWALADDPGAASFLRGKVRPVEPLPAKEFARLLADLDSDDFATRTEAARQLGAAGERAVGQLQNALKGELPAEPRAAVLRLVTPWQAAEHTPPTGERLRVVRAVAALELAGTADARKLLAELAVGAADATTTREAKTALDRLGR